MHEYVIFQKKKMMKKKLRGKTAGGERSGGLCSFGNGR